MFVGEAGLGFGGGPRGGRVLRVSGGKTEVVAEGFAQPLNGLVVHEDRIYVSEGGAGRITSIDLDGQNPTPIVEGMPGPGNYHTNTAVVGPDGRLYFTQGAMTNMGIVGLDAYEMGWLRRLPHAHDVPGLDMVLTGVNVTTNNPLPEIAEETVATGAFSPFGTATGPGQVVPAGTPPTAAVMRCNPDGSELELVAWGVRNGYGIGFLPDGRLIVIDQGADDRGSRPIGNAPDLVWEIQPDRWYGWPDFVGGIPVTDPQFKPERGPALTFLLANHDSLPAPEKALYRFEPHAAAVKFAVVPESIGKHAGKLLVALFGDEAPMTAPAGSPKVGRSLALLDPATWTRQTLVMGAPLSRPIDVAFKPGDEAAYVLDFGHFEMSVQGVVATAGTGKVYRWGGWARA
ncbi:MAG TPA: sugar dehydrogenase [Candidatus Dormibacteraeota bacterium]|jgi:glucose/arabinose dehydrogenase|nr:sugar dehydrogenase [Candidatus Dormibacteraeota bacterium]